MWLERISLSDAFAVSIWSLPVELALCKSAEVLHLFLSCLLEHGLVGVVSYFCFKDFLRIDGVVKSTRRAKNITVKSFSYKFLLPFSLLNVVGKGLEVKALLSMLLAGCGTQHAFESLRVHVVGLGRFAPFLKVNDLIFISDVQGFPLAWRPALITALRASAIILRKRGPALLSACSLAPLRLRSARHVGSAWRVGVLCVDEILQLFLSDFVLDVHAASFLGEVDVRHEVVNVLLEQHFVPL